MSASITDSSFVQGFLAACDKLTNHQGASMENMEEKSDLEGFDWDKFDRGTQVYTKWLSQAFDFS